MKYSIAIISCIILFTQCRTKKTDTIQPTGSYDTLGISWTTIEKVNIIYYFQDYNTQSEYAEKYVNAHEDAYTTTDQVFKAKLPRKLRFFIWSDEALAKQLLNRSLGYTVPKQCICYVRPNQTLGHEMTHALSYWAGGTPPIAFTRFVNEGVAVAFDLNQEDKMEKAKAALVGQNITTVTHLWSDSSQSVPEEILYPVAGAFMDFLYKQNLPDQFNALIKNQTIESAENIYGKDRLDSLIKSFDSTVGL